MSHRECLGALTALTPEPLCHFPFATFSRMNTIAHVFTNEASALVD